MAKKTKYAGKWLNFFEVSFTNSQGESREWEYAARTGTGGAACMVAIEDGQVPQLILVKQFRPPVGNYSLEFPAGLVDPGESLQSAALRELEEETGFVGEVIHVGPPIYSSPGMTDEIVSLITIKITGKTQVRPGDDECMEVLKVPLPELLPELNRIQATGVVIDAKLWSFAQGLSWNPPG